MNFDNQIKSQNPYHKEQQNGWMNQFHANNKHNLNQDNNNNLNNQDINPFQNNEIDEYSGYINEVSNIYNENALNYDSGAQGYGLIENIQQPFNQNFMDYQPGLLDYEDGLQNQYKQSILFSDQHNRFIQPKINEKQGKKSNQEKLGLVDFQLEKYEKVSEYLLQAENHSLNGIRNTLTYLQNRNFLYNERRCLEILHANNQIFNFDAYKCTMIMCGILLDSAITLVKDQRYYLAEKYLLRAKYMTEPNEKHLKKSITQHNFEKRERKQLKSLNQNNQDNEQIENNQDSQIESESENDEDEDFIFENDLRYHDTRIEIAINLSNIYKQQLKGLKKKRKNQQNKKHLYNSGQNEGGFKRLETGNEIGGMKEIKEEQELEMELEKYDNNKLNVSPPNLQLSQQSSPMKDQQLTSMPNSNQNPGTLSKQRQNQKNMNNEQEERKEQGLYNKDQLPHQQIAVIQRQKEMDEEEDKDEEEKQNENKMEKALMVLNDVESKLTDDYIELSKQDLKGTLCKFYQKKVEVLNELLKYGEDEYSEQEIEEMSKEMLKCAQFVISTLESILLPLKASESSQSQADSVYLATILSYTWTKLGKYLLKMKDIDKAVQCYKNAYERLQNFFREGNDRMFLQDKFKRKYDKFMGKIAFEKIGDTDIVEFSQFQDDIIYQNHQANIQSNKKNYLGSTYGLPSQHIQITAGQFYVDPEYLNQLKSHYTIKSLNKHRHLKKIPISHPFGSSLQALGSQQNNNSITQQNIQQPGSQSGRSFKYKKNLQLQLENYRNQILGLNTSNQAKLTQQDNNYSILGKNNQTNNVLQGQLDLNIQPKTSGEQIELSPDEKIIPFILNLKKTRKHPQSAKVRSSNSAKRQQNEDQGAVTATNLLYNDSQGQQQQDFSKLASSKKQLHRKAPSLSNPITKLNSSTNTQKMNFVDGSTNIGGLGMSQTTVSLKKDNNNKFINSIQDENQQLTQQQGIQQGYFHKKRKDEDTNSQQVSQETMRQAQLSSMSKLPLNSSTSSFMKQIQSPKQYSMYQSSAQYKGFSQPKRVMSAKTTRTSSSQAQQLQTIQTQQQNQITNSIDQRSQMISDGLNSSNKNDPLLTGRSQNELIKGAKGGKQGQFKNNDVTYDMLENIVSFVDSQSENQQKNILNTQKSTASTSSRNINPLQRPSSSIVYFSTSRLFNNAGQSSQKQHGQNFPPEQSGIIYEKYEGNDQSLAQNQNGFNNYQSEYGNYPNHQYYSQQQQIRQQKKYGDNNRFIVVNSKPQSGKDAEKIMNAMGNLRTQLHNLFDQNNEIKVFQSNTPSSNFGKYSIKLNLQQNEQFVEMINRRPSQKVEQNIPSSRTRLSASKNSSLQQGQIQFGMQNNYNINNNNEVYEEEQDEQTLNKQRIKNIYKGSKHQTRMSIRLSQPQLAMKQVKSLTQFEDQNKKAPHLTQQQQSTKQLTSQDRKSEGSSRRINTIDKFNNKNKDMSLSQQQQQNQQNQQQNGSTFAIYQTQNAPSLLLSANNNQQNLLNSQSGKPQNPSPTTKDKDNQNDNQTNRNIITQSQSMLKKKNTENYHDSSIISSQPPILQNNQISNQDNSRILKSVKQTEQTLQNKSGLVNNSKIEEKSQQKQASRRDSVLKRQLTAPYDSEIPTLQNNNEDDKRGMSHLQDFIKSSLQNGKDQIHETQSSQEDDENEQNNSNEDQYLNQQKHDDSQNFNGDVQRGDDYINNGGDELRKSDKRLGNSQIKISQSKHNQQSPDISRMIVSQQQGQDGASSSLHQSFHQQQNNYQNNLQSNQGIHDKSMTSTYPNAIMNNSQLTPNAMTSTNKRMTLSQDKQITSHHSYHQNKDLSQNKTLMTPDLIELKRQNLQEFIKGLRFAPMYFYKSYNAYSLCQWNVTNINITLENAVDDQIKYDIKLCIYLECVITDQHIINNPLIFYLKSQSLNYNDHLYTEEQKKIETKYELAILLLDRWIREREFNVFEELYQIELSYQNVLVQYILRGGDNYRILTAGDYQKQPNQQNQQKKEENLDQLRLFGIKLNFIINKITQVTKRVHGDIIIIPNDLNEINNSQLSVRQNNLKLRNHQNKRRALRNLISYYKIDEINFEYIVEIQNYKRKKSIKYAHGDKNTKRKIQELVPPLLKEKTQKFEKSLLNVGQKLFDDDQNQYQRLNLNKGISNDSPLQQNSVDFQEFTDIQERKRLSTRDLYLNNNNTNLQQQGINNSSSTLQSNSATNLLYQTQNNISFYGTQNQVPSILQQYSGQANQNQVGRFFQKSKNQQLPGQNQTKQQQLSIKSNVVRSQNHHSKMKKRFHQVQYSAHIPLEPQVPIQELKKVSAQDFSFPQNNSLSQQAYFSENYPEGSQESLLQNNYNQSNSSPSQRGNNQLQYLQKNEAEYSSSKQFNNQRFRKPGNNAMQGFSSVIEEQFQGNIGSPNNNLMGSVHSGITERAFEESNIAINEQSKQAEEYKKKYDLSVATVSNTNTPQAHQIQLFLQQSSSNKQINNNFRIEHLKKQVRESVQSQQNQSNAIDQSQSQSDSPRSAGGYSSQNNSFVSSQQNSPVTSPTNVVGSYALQRMSSVHSNKSSKSKFIRYAQNVNDELDDSAQSTSQLNLQQQKKSIYGRLNSKYDNSDGFDDSSSRTPPLWAQQPDRQIAEIYNIMK